MNATRPSTPPHQGQLHQQHQHHKSPLTPEQVRRIEENRLKAKALRAQREAEASTEFPHRTPSGYVAGQKRPLSSTVSTTANTSTYRDARQSNSSNGTAGSSNATTGKPHADIQTARKFTKYIDYDFSKMTDTKGGFLTAEDDPNNRALHAHGQDEKPAHMTLAEWERHQLLKKLRDQKAGPFEPGLSSLRTQQGKDAGCRECGSLELDWIWVEVFGREYGSVCGNCKDKFPDKYSLLTKTEAKEDYLLTDPELRDHELLPHLEKPNPHRANWNNMQLFLRCQVEEYALSERRWGSGQRLDEEWEKRQKDKKRKKDASFKNKLAELKKRTRVDAYKRGRSGVYNGDAQFGDRVGPEKHEHEFGLPLETAEGATVKKCVECGFEVEELEF